MLLLLLLLLGVVVTLALALVLSWLCSTIHPTVVVPDSVVFDAVVVAGVAAGVV
jgi:hypothetical protein